MDLHEPQQSMTSMQVGVHSSKVLIPIIDTCDHGHKFAKLPDHPMKDGMARCPICMASGLDSVRRKYDWFIRWFVSGRNRAVIVPDGHISIYNEMTVDLNIEAMELAERLPPK